MTIRLAVFDCDGTLIDGQVSICEAMEHAFAQCGLPPPARSVIRRSVGLSLPQAVRSLAPDAGEPTYGALVEAYKRGFGSAREAGTLAQPLFPGIAETLDALRADGWLLAVATGMSRRGLVHCLAANGVADRFVSLQNADRHPSKPHPAMLQAALDEAGADRADAVMIGDTQYDMEMGWSIGVRAIGVEWGYHLPAELRAAGAEWVAATPSELAEHLLR
ncbi:MAG: HAD-IA family hydrolase [Novosphingobium sp.]